MKALILAKSGFGKTTSLGNIPELGIKGLDPKTTFLISCVNKPLPFKGGTTLYKITDSTNPKGGNRVITSDGKVVADLVKLLSSSNSPFQNIVIDDLNYVSQDYYMKNALKGGWDTPKVIGYTMGQIFDAINEIPETKNLIVFAHFEEYKDKNGDSLSYRYKSTGNMIDSYITPEGKFEIVLFGKSSYNESEKKAIKEFVTNDDGQFPAKSPFGMFSNLYIPNDLGYIVEQATIFNKG